MQERQARGLDEPVGISEPPPAFIGYANARGTRRTRRTRSLPSDVSLLMCQIVMGTPRSPVVRLNTRAVAL